MNKSANYKNHVCAIVLAAGASTRMKTQKLLLPFNEKTIIETVVENALKITGNVVVVLGSHKEAITEKLAGLNISIAENENYLQGMLSSVICGFSAVPVDAKAVLIFLGDQPQVPYEAAEMVIDAWRQSGFAIAIPTFSGRRGHPVLIETRYLPEILKLDPEKGLRQLMEQFKTDIFEVDCQFSQILRDIDTPEEYEIEIKSL